VAAIKENDKRRPPEQPKAAAWDVLGARPSPSHNASLAVTLPAARLLLFVWEYHPDAAEMKKPERVECGKDGAKPSV
jgi:hypothetical protein